MLKKKPIVFLDTETTGLDENYHEIISVCIISNDTGQIWTYKAKPDHPTHIDPTAILINGYNKTDWIDAMSQSQLACILGQLLQGKIIVGHNPKFDISFVKNLLWKNQINTWIDFRGIDTTTLAFVHLAPYGLNKLSLDSIRKFLGWKVHLHHEAMQDTIDCKNLYLLLTNPWKRTLLKCKLAIRNLNPWKK